MVALETVMGFANTAKFFEWRAAKARDADNQARLADEARFWRSLEHIAPDFPHGYDIKKLKQFTNRWDHRAEECRTMAESFTDQECRARMLRLADSYSKMSTAAE